MTALATPRELSDPFGPALRTFHRAFESSGQLSFSAPIVVSPRAPWQQKSDTRHERSLPLAERRITADLDSKVCAASERDSFARNGMAGSMSADGGDSQTTATARAVGHNQIGGSLRPPGLQSFNTEVTAMLRALRVEGLMVTEYTEPLPGIEMLIRT